jgi:hypothetical protein
MVETTLPDGANDFDFFVGTWDVVNRRLGTRLAGSDDWAEFPATSTCWRLFGGAGNVDEIVFPTEGFAGTTLRLFDPARQEWSLYWASSRTGKLEPPVVGRFRDGRGDFYGDDAHDGTPIRVHFIWSEITPTSARWEQEFSTDSGDSWESNWVMQFTRTGS